MEKTGDCSISFAASRKGRSHFVSLHFDAVWFVLVLKVCVEYTSAIKRLTAATMSTAPSSSPQKPLIFRRDARQPLDIRSFKILVGGKDGESGFETSAHVGESESSKAGPSGEGAKGEQEIPGSVDTVLTSPPYPGVYDYLSHARSTRSALGRLSTTSCHGGGQYKDSSLFLDPVPSGRNWGSAWTVGEVGARSEVRRRRRSEASSEHEVSTPETTWENDQKDWLLATTRAVRAGGRLAIMIGDGDGIDTRSSLLRAVEVFGKETALQVVGWVTLRAAEGTRRSMRTEHLVLLEKS